MSNLFSVKSVLTTLKIAVVGIPIALGSWAIQFVQLKFMAFGTFLMVLWALFALFLWGWMANKIWGWS